VVVVVLLVELELGGAGWTTGGGGGDTGAACAFGSVVVVVVVVVDVVVVVVDIGGTGALGNVVVDVDEVNGFPFAGSCRFNFSISSFSSTGNPRRRRDLGASLIFFSSK
jgi:hypothetical protein